MIADKFSDASEDNFNASVEKISLWMKNDKKKFKKMTGTRH